MPATRCTRSRLPEARHQRQGSDHDHRAQQDDTQVFTQALREVAGPLDPPDEIETVFDFLRHGNGRQNNKARPTPASTSPLHVLDEADDLIGQLDAAIAQRREEIVEQRFQSADESRTL